MKLIDGFLNRITMYRLVLYVLCVLWGAAFLFSLIRVLPYSPVDLVFSLVLVNAVSWLTNMLFARAFGAIPNIESYLISAFILALVVDPVAPTSATGIGFLAIVSALAMASKYLLAFRKKHLFNPVAVGLFGG